MSFDDQPVEETPEVEAPVEEVSAEEPAVEGAEGSVEEPAAE
jgi:hypothetical protein